jgi:hypothetical protein
MTFHITVEMPQLHRAAVQGLVGDVIALKRVNERVFDRFDVRVVHLQAPIPYC